MRCIVALVVCGSVWADTPENLVKALGSASFAEREAASAELLKLGVAALPAVQAAAESSDAEVRERAMALLEPLKKTSESSRLLAVKPIVFDGKTMAVGAAIAEVKSKTGLPLQIVAGKVDTARSITMPNGEFEPWEGLAAFLKAAGLKEDHRAELPSNGQPANNGSRYYGRRGWDYGGEEQPMVYNCATAPILLVDGVGETLPSNAKGSIRVTALPAGFSSNRVIRGNGRVVFHLDVAPIPATGWHGGTGIRIHHAEDEDGRPVFADYKLAYDPINMNNYYGGGFGRRVFWGGGGNMWIDETMNGSGTSPYQNPRLVAVAIRTNDRALKTLKKFEGVVLGDVHTANQPVVTIDNLEKSAGTTHSGPQQSNLQVQEFKVSEKDKTVTLKIRHEALTQWALQNMRGNGAMLNFTVNENPNDILNKLVFYSADGKALAKPNVPSTNYNGDGWRQSVEMTLVFPKGVTPAKMVLTGTKITPVEVPFKLENVSVP